MNQSNDADALVIGQGVYVSREAVRLRVETPGGPGGQHANRAKTRVVASVRLEDVASLSETDRQRLIDALGPIVRSSASRFRSQYQNREAAIAQLPARLREALAPRPERRPTRPTASSRIKRVESKRARSRLKQGRLARDDD